MSEVIKACIDRVLTGDQLEQAAKLAMKENPKNEPPVIKTPLGAAPPSPLFMALVTGKRWKPGRTLRVLFLDGTAAVQEKVKSYALQWTKVANIKLKFGTAAPSEIRISFAQSGSWSYLGTDALTIDGGSPTMNFGWLTEGSTEEEYSRVVLHEFGHALACIHEHQNPAAKIPWKKQAVYDYYMGPPNNWTKEDVDNNLFKKYSSTISQFSTFDTKSIMLYPIPQQFTTGGFEVGWNTQLSTKDKQFIRRMYPAAT